MEVSLPWDFDYALTGRQKEARRLANGEKLGVRTVDGKKLKLSGGSEWAVIVPEGKKGKAFSCRA